ncbi:MAG: glycosyltransferase family 2 protein [Actinobacteria bacterium]|nr:glycosyltransferase family 2 protein [Actinomycetota bacterium]MBW3646318.1 glycosyltransferase family 2 protein [Actinomycetota bacterium]
MTPAATATALRGEVAVLVVAYGQPELLERSLSSVRELRGVVVDNSSDREVCKVVEQHGFSYLAPGDNLGFAGGVNLGLAELGRQPTTPYVLLLNPDATLHPDDLERLRSAIRADDQLAAVAPTLVSPDGRTEPTVWPGPSPAQAWAGAVGLRRTPRFTFLNGAVLLLSRRALEAVGGFDTRFFMYAEECDWQYRATRAGWHVAHATEARAVHVGGATSSDPRRRLRWFHTSAALYVEKWYGRRGATIFLIGTAVAALRRIFTGGSEQRQAHVLALRLAAKNLRALYDTGLSHPQRGPGPQPQPD